MGTKHIPQRTCIVCRTVRAKRELLRIVRTTENQVAPDPTGKRAGRGAYLCRQRDCWESALAQRGRLEQALKLETPISEENLVSLRQFAMTLPSRVSNPAALKNETT